MPWILLALIVPFGYATTTIAAIIMRPPAMDSLSFGAGFFLAPLPILFVAMLLADEFWVFGGSHLLSHHCPPCLPKQHQAFGASARRVQGFGPCCEPGDLSGDELLSQRRRRGWRLLPEIASENDGHAAERRFRFIAEAALFYRVLSFSAHF